MSRYAVILLCLFSFGAKGQVYLSLQDAISKGLAHNFDIQIADESQKMAEANNTLGNAGFSPSVIANGGVSGSNYNTHNELTTGAVQENPHAKSTSYTASAALGWTLFDGGKMFILKKELTEMQRISIIQYKAQVQTSVSRIIQMYAQTVWQQRQLIAVDTALVLAKTRMYISQVKYESGAGPKIDYLQARVDYNARQSDSLQYEYLLTQAFDSLSVLMGENEDTKYKVDDSLHLNTSLQPIDKDQLTAVNLTVDVFRRNALVSRYNERIAKTYMLPNLSANGGYYYTRSTSSTGFSSFSRAYGPSGALNLSIPLFEGGNLRRQAKVAGFQAMKDELAFDKQNTVTGRLYRTAWKNYQVSVAAFHLERENIQYAKENLDVQLQRFKLGAGTTLEARQAENDYVTALETLYTAEYNLKVNETIVLELENQLIK